MISLFALLSIFCGTKCSQIVEVCAQSKQHYQGLLSWGLLCQELVKRHGKKKKTMKNSPGSRSLFAPSRVTPNNCSNQTAPESFHWLLLVNITAGWNKTRDVTGNSSPHSEARPLGVCCHSQTRFRDHFCETVQTWPEWVHNPRAGRAPSIPLAVTQLRGMLTRPKMDPGSGC